MSGKWGEGKKLPSFFFSEFFSPTPPPPPPPLFAPATQAKLLPFINSRLSKAPTLAYSAGASPSSATGYQIRYIWFYAAGLGFTRLTTILLLPTMSRQLVIT